LNNESTIYSEVLDAMGMPIDLLILEGIAALITFVAITLIVIASIKIYKAGNIPGGKLMLASLLGSIVVTLISASFVMYSDEENNIITGTFEIILALLFFLGAFGFLKLAKYFHDKKC
jgi:hypothetical protein